MNSNKFKELLTNMGYLFTEEKRLNNPETVGGEHLTVTITHADKKGSLRFRKDALKKIDDIDVEDLYSRIMLSIMWPGLQVDHLGILIPKIDNTLLAEMDMPDYSATCGNCKYWHNPGDSKGLSKTMCNLSRNGSDIMRSGCGLITNKEFGCNQFARKDIRQE